MKTKAQSSHPPRLILRDYLAVDRTSLANERTLIAHLSGGTAILVAGLSGFNLFQNLWIRGISISFMILGGGIFIGGIVVFLKMHKKLEKLKTHSYDEILQETQEIR